MCGVVASPLVCSDPAQCYEVGPRGCVTSGPGTKCARCDGGRGYVNATTQECVFETFVFDQEVRVNIRSLCGPQEIGDDVQCSQFGTCGPSKYGIMCDECSGRGFLDTFTSCQCYEPWLDPSRACQSSFDVRVDFQRPFVHVHDRVECVAHKSRVLGCYADATEPFKYGQRGGGSVPTRCCNELYGPPPPGVIQQNLPVDTCNSYGSYDPEALFGPEQDSSFRTCSMHGAFNRTTFACECDEHWVPRTIGFDGVRNVSVQSCMDCERYWGPPTTGEFAPPFCVVPWLPDEKGESAECSGHGTFASNSVCVCFGNSTAGFWDLVRVEGIDTCLRCQTGYGPPGDCRFVNGETPSPTTPAPSASPSASPVTAALGNATCPVCVQQSLGLAIIQFSAPAVTALVLGANSTSTPCCANAGAAAVLVDENTGMRFPGGFACVNSFFARQSLGWAYCAALQGCTAFSWYVSPNSTFTYKFVNATTSFSYTESLQAGSSFACDANV